MGENKFFWGVPDLNIEVGIPAKVTSLAPAKTAEVDTVGIVPRDFKCEFSFYVPEVDESIVKLLTDGFQEAYREYWEKVRQAIETIIHNYIDKPIQGEITEKEIKKRKLFPVFIKNGFDNNEYFVGVMQKKNIIFTDGSRMKVAEFEKITHSHINK